MTTISRVPSADSEQLFVELDDGPGHIRGIRSESRHQLSPEWISGRVFAASAHRSELFEIRFQGEGFLRPRSRRGLRLRGAWFGGFDAMRGERSGMESSAGRRPVLAVIRPEAATGIATPDHPIEAADNRVERVG